MTMTIEQKLEMLRKAMEMGAHVEVSFHNPKDSYTRFNKEQAEEITSEFNQVDFVPKYHGGSHWFKSKHEDFSISVFYQPVASDFLEEDVVLDGMKEEMA
jgi:hypothetical protein